MTPLASRTAPLLDVRDLRKSFAANRLFARGTVTCAARDVSFQLEAGQAVALVGESGSGKSTIARLILGLERPDAGEVRVAGSGIVGHGRVPLAWRRRVQMVFQDPFTSLNPVHDVAHHLERPLRRHGMARASAAAVRARALELLGTVGLEPPADFIARRPHELSGGQRQRVAIARALAVDPEVLVADEPTSMLDVSIRMGVLNLLARLKRERRLGILLITHDLASARYLADRILVLYRGRLVEDGPTAAIIAAPAHPYTRALLAAIAGAQRPAAETTAANGEADAAAEAGCPFAARCPERFAPCALEDPAPRAVGDRMVRCHLHPPGAR